MAKCFHLERTILDNLLLEISNPDPTQSWSQPLRTRIWKWFLVGIIMLGLSQVDVYLFSGAVRWFSIRQSKILNTSSNQCNLTLSMSSTNQRWLRWKFMRKLWSHVTERFVKTFECTSSDCLSLVELGFCWQQGGTKRDTYKHMECLTKVKFWLKYH